ncbi:MAG: hypothetical protein ACI8Q9_002297 [Planctomycetota bacterium]
MEGVIETRSGFLGGGEIVEVSFDPRRLPYAELLQYAADNDCASKVFTRSDEHQKIASAAIGKRSQRSDEAIRNDKDPKFYLGKTALAFLPMTELQANRVNATINGGDWSQWLSPRQIERVIAIEKRLKKTKLPQPPVAIGVDMIQAQVALDRVLSKSK